MNVKEVYKKYHIPPNLQEHMLSVTKVVTFISNHWEGEQLVWNNLTLAALLHDIGNIVRFDFDKHPEFLGDVVKNIDHWRTVQAETIKKYGNDDHQATVKILGELKVDEQIVNIILSKSFGNSIKIAEGDNWYTKILYYSDMRVTPQGIVSLTERLADIRKRALQYLNRPDYEQLFTACKKVEEQIKQHIAMDLNDISTKTDLFDNSLLLGIEI